MHTRYTPSLRTLRSLLSPDRAKGFAQGDMNAGGFGASLKTPSSGDVLGIFAEVGQELGVGAGLGQSLHDALGGIGGVHVVGGDEADHAPQ